MSLIALLSAGLGAGGVIAYDAAVRRPPGAACGAGTAAMVRLELLFGLGMKGGGRVSEPDWLAFLDAEVTPRFPDGLTVLDGQGQWRSGDGAVVKEASKVLVIWHRPAVDSGRKVEAIRAAYKARFGQQSVMRVDGTSCVSF